jgi:hypothetical protein
MRDDGFDDFDEDGWANDDLPADHDGEDTGSDAGDGRNGHSRQSARLLQPGDGGALVRADAEADEGATSEGWLIAGGVARWEAPDDVANPHAEADSPLAADGLTLPEGAPDAPRVRAVHAWIVRQRADEDEALGALLLAQREQRAHDDAQPQPRRRGAYPSEPEPSPLDLTLAEHQSAADEYDALLAALEEHAAHSGPGRALVEYYLWLVEHLATLAAEPEAASAARPPATLAAAGWRGRAQAALGVRGRVERMTAPPAEE